MADRHDRSVIHLPGGKIHQFLHAADAPVKKAPPEAFEVYPDENDKILVVGQKINEMFKFKNIHNDEWPKLIETIITMFDEIGFEVGVEIMDAVNPNTGRPITGSDGFPMRVPSIAFLGRTKNKETEIDHDRMRHGIVTGKVDGVKGYIREDGQLHEEPRKKLIY